uniref:kinesin-like protein KIF26B isoform X2 n=1 Tax=Doryrhamphus excisus TaxID=161450 RepID=UPI0025AE6167|nr:kinesin-like protein KIF26B isoform X2 [Doryrhamphus excisus]
MSSLTGGGETFTTSVRGKRLEHHCEFSRVCSTIKDNPKERPTPEGAGGFRSMYHQRGDAVPSYKSLPGSVGERIMSLGETLHRNTNPGLGRSERKDACCERCSATLVALKKQALSLSVHHHFSCKETNDLSAFLHDNLRVHSRSTTESRDRCRDQGECPACGTKLNHLKQEAIHLALSRGPSSTTRTATPPGHGNAKLGDRSSSQPHSLNQTPQSPRTPRSPRTPQTLRRRVPNQDMDRWVEEQQHQHHRGSSLADGVTVYAHKQASDNAVLRCTDLVHTSSKIPHLSRVVTIANTAAMSFLARAAEKLNLTLRKKGQASDAAPAHLSNGFKDIIQKNPPPVPSCLLQAATRSKDSPNVGKVKVVLRVNPTTNEGQPPVLHVDPCKKRAILLEPVCQSSPRTRTASSGDLLKAFHYDAVYPQDSSQTEVCSGVLADVIRCVLSGSDGCVLGLGCADVGSWSSMVGNAESIQKLGLIPCAISWLYSAIEKRREKTWTDMTVSVSAVELCCGEEDTLRDLLGEVAPPSLGSIHDSPRAHIRLQEDPIHGIQLRNHNRVKAVTAERAASLLDVAIAARRHNDFTTFLSHSSIMFFTLHVQPPRTESNTTGKGSRGPTKLTMIDVCSGMKGGVGYVKNKPPHSELGPVVLSLLSGNKTIPKKGSKLAMLLRESLSHANCHTAVVAQVANSLALLQETTSIIQLASRIRRTQKRTKSSSCSPNGRSLTRQKRGPPSFSLRAFHSTDEVDVDVQRFRLRGELDEHSSSDQSCDTVIQIDSDGLIQPRAPPRFSQPEFVPIIPSLHPSKADMEDAEFTALLQELLKIPKLHSDNNSKEDAQGFSEGMKAEPKKPERDCLKCDTFAELQERLGCIDGSEETMDLLKSSSKIPSGNTVPTKPQSPKEIATTESSETPQMLKQGLNNQTLLREKQTDGAVPGDNFQREDSGLYDCEECSATSSSEEPLNQSLNRKNTACRYQIRKTGTQSSQDVNVKTIAEKPDNHEATDWFKADKRTSPVGKSLPASPPSPSDSSPVAGGVMAPHRPAKDAQEMKATITVTVQQPLDFAGQDELVFSMVEEVTISGGLDRGRTGGNIICIKDTAQSSAHLPGPAGSKPIQIISNIGKDSTATSPTDVPGNTFVRFGDTATDTEKSHSHSRRQRTLPSFINPMLMNLDEQSEVKNPKHNEITHSELKGNTIKFPEVHSDVYKSVLLEDTSCSKAAMENKQHAEKNHPRDREHVSSANPPKTSSGEDFPCRRLGNYRCLETASASLNTGSLPRSWLDASHTADVWRHPRGVTSSTPCSPGVTLERRRGQQSSPVNQSLSYPKYDTDFKQEAKRPLRKGVGSLFDSPHGGVKHDHMQRKMMSPLNESGSLSSAKTDQLGSRTIKSLGRNQSDFPRLDPGSSNTSLNSKGSSKRSSEGASKGAHKGKSPGNCTLPRSSKTSRKSRQTNHGHNSSENVPQSRPSHSKLSAVGKLKMACPKVRRLSAPSIKNLSLPNKSLQESVNRSSSLSPDSRSVSFERTSSFVSSSPPLSFHSMSRTPSQSSTCSSTKSAIQGFTIGRISELLRERSDGPDSVAVDQTGSLPSPYSQVTSPRTPPHMSGHASDATSVLSGDLPPAMGKTSLYFSNRNSTMSSGYDSLLRDSEATGSGASNRDSTSDRSGSLLREARGSRSSRRRGNTGSHPRYPSQDPPLSTRQSSNAVQSRWADHGIPENYDIKVYEIDNRQRIQRKAGGRMLQRQAAVLGGQTGDDHRQLEQRRSQTGVHRVESRLRPLPDFQGGLSGAPGGP